jgi:hypothetical protein
MPEPTWYLKSNIDAGGLADSTNVSGYTDVSDQWSVASHVIVNTAGGGVLKNDYSVANPQQNQRVVFENVWGASEFVILNFRRGDDTPVNTNAFEFQSGFGVLVTWNTASAGGNTSTGPFAFVVGHHYRFDCKIWGGTSDTVFSVTAFDVTANAPALFNGGSDTFTFTASEDIVVRSGWIEFVGTSCNLTKIAYYDDQVPAHVGPGVGSITARTDTSISISFTDAEDDTDFTGPFTIENWRQTDPLAVPPSGLHLVAFDGQNSFTDTGLAPDTYYHYVQHLVPTTGSARNTISADIPGGYTRVVPLPVPSLMQMGDSRTGIGTPHSVTVMASQIADYLGVDSVASIANPHLGGNVLTGWDAVNHVPFTPLIDCVDDAEAANVTDMIFQNDISVNDDFLPAFVFQITQEVIDYVRARALADGWTTLKRIWLYPCLPRDMYGINGDVGQISHVRQRALQQLYADYILADQGSGGITLHMVPIAMYDYLIVHPEMYTPPDGIHQNQDGINVMGRYAALGWIAAVDHLDLGASDTTIATGYTVAVYGPHQVGRVDTVVVAATPAGSVFPDPLTLGVNDANGGQYNSSDFLVGGLSTASYNVTPTTVGTHALTFTNDGSGVTDPSGQNVTVIAAPVADEDNPLTGSILD